MLDGAISGSGPDSLTPVDELKAVPNGVPNGALESPVFISAHEPLSSELRPKTDAVLTIRVIKSFEFRTFKALVLKGLDLETLTIRQLKERCVRDVKTAPGFKAYRSLELDTLKLYTVAHGHKTTNLIVNLDHDEWILSDPHKTLAEIGAEVKDPHQTFVYDMIHDGNRCGSAVAFTMGEIYRLIKSFPENETELSLFNRAAYAAFKLNPERPSPTPQQTHATSTSTSSVTMIYFVTSVMLVSADGI